MSRAIDHTTAGLAKILDPVAQCFTPEVAKRVAELGADPAVQARIEKLAEKCNKGTITPEEMVEYDAYIYLEPAPPDPSRTRHRSHARGQNNRRCAQHEPPRSRTRMDRV